MNDERSTPRDDDDADHTPSIVAADDTGLVSGEILITLAELNAGEREDEPSEPR